MPMSEIRTPDSKGGTRHNPGNIQPGPCWLTSEAPAETTAKTYEPALPGVAPFPLDRIVVEGCRG